jgi:response regulator of citrate/malate metabolism|tara:strand:- start:211 stop:399 length:189 start_codon:yes stop_codon:yes gene_type:complete
MLELINRAKKEIELLNVICSSDNLEPNPSDISMAQDEIILLETYIKKENFTDLKEYFDIIDG